MVRLGNGRTGIEHGMQTMAVSSYKVALLSELAPDVDKLEKKRQILRKMNRSTTANSPYNFNMEGSYKTSNR
ncbi:MAG: hypothetical protein K6T88_15340 [Bacillus sp. (in: Bacteria)]|nr:hypothetical protein [Bacillus sp. (in: firmicutes)]